MSESLVTPESLVVMVNVAIVGAALVGAGAFLARGGLSVEQPSAKQNFGEFVLGFFYGKANDMARGESRMKIMQIVMPMLATFFLFIIVSNMFAVLPFPVLNRPPTSHFSVTLGLALCSVIGTLVASSLVRGPGPTLKHLFWPNPMQWISEITDVLSLSLRLFGNIAGEYMTVLLVLSVVPWGIPLILHALGLIPAFVQALVFTLLTASYMAAAISHEEKKQASATSSLAPARASGAATAVAAPQGKE